MLPSRANRRPSTGKWVWVRRLLTVVLALDSGIVVRKATSVDVIVKSVGHTLLVDARAWEKTRVADCLLT